jgi:hypothetical protein
MKDYLTWRNMESNYPESWHRHTPKGMNIVNTTTKSKKCCDTCQCEETTEFNKLMETQTSFEE